MYYCNFNNSVESHLQGLPSIKFPSIAGIPTLPLESELDFLLSSQLEYHYDIFLEILQ